FSRRTPAPRRRPEPANDVAPLRRPQADSHSPSAREPCMIRIKLMREGDPWVGEMTCEAVPRVGEQVYIGSGGYEVVRVLYELDPRGSGHPPPLLRLSASTI